MTKLKIRETELYCPVKTFLERQGYQVKSEIGAADLVAVRGSEEPLIVELKTAFSLSLFHQAVERKRISDLVYIAVPKAPTNGFTKSLRKNKKLCRLLGIGLITVRMKDGFVEPLVDPGPYRPQKSKVRKNRLLREFEKRKGDPNLGGAERKRLITAYRQDALRCVKTLLELGPLKAAEVARLSEVSKARRIMADNHYGWFERVQTGIYALSENGRTAAGEYRPEMNEL
ncbi:MAG: DUF2161 domain-containing phosphodiesterase [Hyphomicrobiales bacterium]